MTKAGFALDLQEVIRKLPEVCLRTMGDSCIC